MQLIAVIWIYHECFPNNMQVICSDKKHKIPWQIYGNPSVLLHWQLLQKCVWFRIKGALGQPQKFYWNQQRMQARQKRERVNPASQEMNKYIYTVSDHSGFQLVHFWTGLSKSFAIFQAQSSPSFVTLVIPHPSAPATASPFEVSSLDLPRCSGGQTPWRVKLHSALPCPNPMAANCTSQVSPWSIRRVSLGD